MSTTVDDLLVRVIVDSSGAVKGFETASGAVAKFAEGTEHAESKGNLLEKSLGALGIKTIALNQALELGKKAYEAIKEPLDRINEAYQKQLKSETLLANALKIKGQYTAANMADFKEFTEQLEKTSDVSATASLRLLGIAKASGFADDQAKDLTRTAADLAAAFDEDLNTAFQQLLALQKGESGELEKFFPKLREMTKVAKEAGAGMDFVRQKVKGFADEASKTKQGAAAQLANAIEGIMVEIGRTIDEVFGRAPEKTRKLVAALGAVKQGVIEFKNELLRVKAVLNEINFEELAKSIMNVGKAAAFVAAEMGIFFAVTKGAAAVGGIKTFSDLRAALQLFASELAGPALSALGGFVARLGTIAAMTVGFIAIAAAVDILFRNLNRLPQLGSLIVESFNLIFIQFRRGLLAASQTLNETFISVLEKASKLPVVGKTMSEALDQARQSAANGADAWENLNKKFDDSAVKIVHLKEGIDSGFAGQAIDTFNKLLDGSYDRMKKVGEEAKKKGTGDRGAIMDANKLKMIQEQVLAMDLQQVALGLEMNNIEADTVTQLENQRQLDQLQLAIQKERLSKEGLLTKELAAQFGITEKMINANAKKKTDVANKPNLFAPDDLKKLKDAFGESAGEFAKKVGGGLAPLSGLTTAIGGMAGAVMGIIDAILDFVQKVIDFVPSVLSKIAGIFNSLTDLPNKLAKGVQDVMNSMVNFVTNFIPNLLNSIPRILNSLIGGLFERIPDAAKELFKSIPDIVAGVIKQLPSLVGRLIQGITESGPQILSSFLSQIPRTIGVIFQAIVKAIPPLIHAIIMAVINSARDIAKGLFSTVGNIKLDPSGAKKVIDDLGKAVNSISSDVFKVMDLSAKAKGATLAEQIKDAIDEGTDRFNNIWKQMVAALKAVWLWVYDKILTPLWNALKAVWQWVDEHIVGPMIDGIKGVWKFVYDNIITPMINATEGLWKDLRGVWDGINKDVIQPMLKLLGDAWTALQTVWKTVNDTVIKPMVNLLTDAWKAVLDFFKNVFGGKVGDAFSGVIDFFKNSWNDVAGKPLKAFKDAFDQLKNISVGAFTDFQNSITKLFGTPSWLSDLKDAANKISGGMGGAASSGGGGVLNQAKKTIFGGNLGGMIPGYADGGLIGGTYSPALIDGKMIRSNPGEFMMQRPAVAKYGADFMDQVNKGQFQPQAPAQHITISKLEVNVQAQKLDDNYIEHQLAPKIMDRLYKESTRGKQILDARGIRK